MPGCSTRPQSCMLTYLSMRTAPVSRSISTPQKSKMKPWQSDEFISSASLGASSCGGGRPVVACREPRERQRVVGIAARAGAPVDEIHILCSDVELGGGAASKP